MKLKPFSYLKLVTLLAALSLLIFQYSCKKQQNIPTSSSNNNNGFVDINQLRPEMKVQTSEVFNWIYANVPVAHQGSLQLNKIQQRFIDNHHVIKIPIQDDAALFFTKDSAKLKVYAYKWDEQKPGAWEFTGHIVSFSFQDFSTRAMKYYNNKRIKDGTLKTGNSFMFSQPNKGVAATMSSNTISTQSLLVLNGEEKIKAMSLLSDIWCILTGGKLYSIVGSTGNGCDYSNGWLQQFLDLLSRVFGGNDGSSSSDGSSYGNDPSNPTGAWYGPGAYTGPSPADGGGGGGTSSPATQPYQGGPIWVSTWVDTTNPDNCTALDENGQMVHVQGGCSSGYWQSVQILEYPGDDSNGIEEIEASSDREAEGPQDILPSDNVTYAEYQSGTPWPDVRDVIGWNRFVPYDKRQCFALAKQQIGTLNYTTTGWVDPSSLIFKIYNEHNTPQVNLSVTKTAITYINGALQSGIPVLVGIDYTTNATRNYDNTTDHFVVIVGAGTDTNGKYYRFYDNGTPSISRGTNPDNKLYYDETTGLISGHSHVGTLSNLTYKVTHVRKSIHQ